MRKLEHTRSFLVVDDSGKDHLVNEFTELHFAQGEWLSGLRTFFLAEAEGEQVQPIDKEAIAFESILSRIKYTTKP